MKTILTALWAKLIALIFRVSDLAIDKAIAEFTKLDAKLEAVIKANEDTVTKERELRAASITRSAAAADRISRAARVQGKVRQLID